MRLAEIWLTARETDRGLQAYKKAAEITGNPEITLKIAQVLLSHQRWRDATAMTQTVIKAGDRKQVAQAYLLQGIAFFELGEYNNALKSLAAIEMSDRQFPESQKWIGQIKSVLASLQ